MGEQVQHVADQKRAPRTMLPIGVYVPLSRLGEFRKGAVKREKKGIGPFRPGSVADGVSGHGPDGNRRATRPGAHPRPPPSPQALQTGPLLGGRPGGGVGVLNAPYRKEVAGADRIGVLMKRRRSSIRKGYSILAWESSEPDPLSHGHAGPDVHRQALPQSAPGSAGTGFGPRTGSVRRMRLLYCLVSHQGDWISSTPKGRIELAREVSRTRTPRSPAMEEQARAVFSCTLCGRCAQDCCVAIDSPTLWVQARQLGWCGRDWNSPASRPWPGW